jgi:hypothetical protein
MIYQVSYGPTFTGYATSQDYIDADSYAQALSRAYANCHHTEKVQWVHYIEEDPNLFECSELINPITGEL